jgi:endonuclease/exonuclease/phosphatase (EEP) superfamily protein YafD
MSLNTLRGQSDPAQVLQTVIDESIDVLCLVEVTPELHNSLLEAGLASHLPFVSPGRTTDGVGLSATIWSRHPVIRTTTVDATHDIVVICDLTVDGAPVTVATVHMINPTAGAKAWHTDYETLTAALTNHPTDVPLVVAGDFNATAHHHPLKKFAQQLNLTSSMGVSLPWAQPTWPTNLPGIRPVMRIDHIWTNEAAHASQPHTRAIAGSDHSAVMATIHHN